MTSVFVIAGVAAFVTGVWLEFWPKILRAAGDESAKSHPRIARRLMIAGAVVYLVAVVIMGGTP